MGQPGPKSLGIFHHRTFPVLSGAERHILHTDGTGHCWLRQGWRCPWERRVCPCVPSVQAGLTAGLFPNPNPSVSGWGGGWSQPGWRDEGMRTSRAVPKDRAGERPGSAGRARRGHCPIPRAEVASLSQGTKERFYPSALALGSPWGTRGTLCKAGGPRSSSSCSEQEAAGAGADQRVLPPALTFPAGTKPGCQSQAVQRRFNAQDPHTSQAQRGEAQAGAGISGRGCQRLISVGGSGI